MSGQLDPFNNSHSLSDGASSKTKARKGDKKAAAPKRRCIGSACIACKRRKSKCDGALPSCAACVAVYGTTCEYDLSSDHRRKGVYKKESTTKPKADTLQTIIEAILNYSEDQAFDLVRRIRTCENLEEIASEIQGQPSQVKDETTEDDASLADTNSHGAYIERELATQIGHMRLSDGTIHFLGGTSNLRFSEDNFINSVDGTMEGSPIYTCNEDIVRSWTTVTSDVDLILHLLQLYFTWHYPSFVTLSKSLFFKDFFRGRPSEPVNRIEYCTPLLVNAMLSLGCHFTARGGARSIPSDSSTAGDHFFREAKRLIIDNDEFENPRLPTVQALALMSVREAGCGREAKGWVYSGMSFRMATEMGLDVKLNMDRHASNLSDEDMDARRITFWGCYQFDKCWSNYLGRPPQLPRNNITCGKFDVFPGEDSELWSPRSDNGIDKSHAQPARTRAVALQMSTLCEISDDLLFSFYSPTQSEKPLNKAAEVKRLSDFHTRLEAWLKNLPKEMEAKEGQLPYVLVMHMFFQLLYIHLFRPFLKYTKSSSPLPSDVSPRKLCTQAAIKISKLLRLYKKTYGLKQICNIVVYIAHSACSIHLLNLPDKDAKRDLGYGVRHLEEIAEFWPCAPRTLATLAVQVRRWKIELPEDVSSVLDRWEVKYRTDHPSPAISKDPSIAASSPPEHLTAPIGMTKNSQGFLQINTGPIDQIPPGLPRGDGSNQLSSESSPLSREIFSQPSASTFNVIPQATRTWPQNRPAFQSLQKRNAPTNLYGGIDSLFEENRDWWYKDQSTFFENWSRRESTAVSGPASDIISDVASNSLQAGVNLMANNPNLNDLETWNLDVNNAFGYGVNGASQSGHEQY